MILLQQNSMPTNASAEPDSRSALLATVPHLRAFARLLKGSRARADTLVQEVIVHARATPRHISPGNDMKLWLFSLAHSLHQRDLQKPGARYEALAGARPHDKPGVPCQEACCASHGFSLAFSELRDEERESLILIEAAGLTYEEAAGVCNCLTETIKSRVSCARERLLQTQADGSAQAPIGSAEALLV